MNILVTGTDGYIGTLLVPVLTERGHTVVGLDTGYYREAQLYDGVQPPGRTIRKDIRRVSEADLEGIDAVVHLAELSNDPLGQHRPELTYAINHQGSVALAKLCQRRGIERKLNLYLLV
jgi:nucleoside-diphosphate-sugar epimerase